MKILFVTNTFEHVCNGPSRFANYLLDLNQIYDHVEIKILTEDLSRNSQPIDSAQIFRLDLKLNFWTKPWGFVYRMFPYYNACVKIRKDFAFDIVVFNNAITGIWSAFKLRTPVLGMINDDNSLSVSRKSISLTKSWIRHLIFHYLEKLACKLETGIIINSKYLSDLVLTKYGINGNKLHILYKGVTVGPQPGFRPINPELPIKVLFVKSDYIRGGLFDLIRALGILTPYKFDLQIIGPLHSHAGKILNAFRFANINLIFLGPASPVEVQNYMKASDLFVVPSHKEAFGVANLEALANGLTVVSTHVGGIPEVLDKGKSGWMASPGDPENLAGIIRYVIQNPEEKLQKQKHGYNSVSQRFTQSQVLSRFLEILTHYKA